MGLVVNSEDYFVLGDSFLRSYYQIYDLERNLLGLSPHVTSYVGAISNKSSDADSFHFGFLDTLIYQTGGPLNNLLFTAGFSYLGKRDLSTHHLGYQGY